MVCSISTTTEMPDNFTIPIVVKACAGLLELEMGRTIHGFVKKSEKKIGSDMFVGSALIELYSKCGEMGDALRVFQEFCEPDVVLWTSMVTGYQQNGNAEEALSFFSKMVLKHGVVPDPVTLVSALTACVQLGFLLTGKSVHGFVIRMGFNTGLSLVNSLLNMYAKTGSVDNARKLFGLMDEKDIISWSSMIGCYTQNGKTTEALGLFNEMVEKRVEFNSVTVVSALQACAVACNISEGRRIHELARRKAFEIEKSVSTALIDMYVKCSCLEEAVYLFKRTPQKDVVLWSVLISGYAQNGLPNESLQLFSRMLLNGCRPDAVTMVKVLMACSKLGVLQQALCLHAYLISSGFDDKVYVGAALIDLYSKSGSLDNSVKVFEGMNKRDIVVWSAMIAGYGIHGLGQEAIGVFNRLTESSAVKPNNITFLSVLSACSHTGLVDEGIEIFNRMVRDFHIEPTLEHYSIMVDLLGRTGKLDEAMHLIDQMAVPSGPHVWGALLGACRIHNNIKMGEIAAKNLLRLDPEHAGYYLLLSNMYGEDGKWENMLKVRVAVKEKDLQRMPGQSTII
ncbi:hypothetical protein IFM89_006389 [Coptis chinensis]|uniref:Pentatricopeptide repeat-containing protein n=1 Tax=Coptis chinensis TaxID=261450 RepID=A0A835HRA8_9MAGN|nr:hypothetical protein IFM89_006389 [Coptis chinensis]